MTHKAKAQHNFKPIHKTNNTFLSQNNPKDEDKDKSQIHNKLKQL